VRLVTGAERPELAELVTVPAVHHAIDRLKATSDYVLVDTAATEYFASRLKAGKCLTLAHARHEILMERDPLRELFWAAFDAFLPERAARDGAAINHGINNTNRRKT